MDFTDSAKGLSGGAASDRSSVRFLCALARARCLPIRALYLPLVPVASPVQSYNCSAEKRWQASGLLCSHCNLDACATSWVLWRVATVAAAAVAALWLAVCARQLSIERAGVIIATNNIQQVAMMPLRAAAAAAEVDCTRADSQVQRAPIMLFSGLHDCRLQVDDALDVDVDGSPIMSA